MQTKIHERQKLICIDDTKLLPIKDYDKGRAWIIEEIIGEYKNRSENVQKISRGINENQPGRL